MHAAVRHSIDDFATGQFRPHGQMEIWKDGNVVRLEVAGPFNTESVFALGRTMQALFASLPPREPFADLVIVRRSLLASPDVLKAFSHFLSDMGEARQAPVAVAWVVPPEVEGGQLMLPLFEKIYATAKPLRRFAAFDSTAEAEAWLAACLRENAGGRPN